MSDMWHNCILFQAKFHIYEVIRVTESAVESKVSSFTSYLCLLLAAELGGINVLLSTETQSKGKLPGSPAEPGASEAAGARQVCLCPWNLFILPGSKGTLWLPRETSELRICPEMCEHETLQMFSRMVSMEVKTHVCLTKGTSWTANQRLGQLSGVLWSQWHLLSQAPWRCLGGTQSLKRFHPEAGLTCSDWLEQAALFIWHR